MQKKNKLNLRICGIHLLNPYKTVVSHLKYFMLFFTSSIGKSLVRIAAEVNLENERFTVVGSRCR